MENNELDEPNIALAADNPTGANCVTFLYFVSAPGALFATKAPSPKNIKYLKKNQDIRKKIYK